MTGDSSFPILLSLRVAAIALLFVAPLGVGLAWMQARRRYALRGLVDAVVLLPLVLPPSVVGFFLVVFLGRRGIIGGWLEGAFGIRLVFPPAGAVFGSSLLALAILVWTAPPAPSAVLNLAA